MNKNIIKYYEERGQHLHKILERRPKELSKKRVFIAIKDVYNEIQKGRQVKNINLAREVWRKAHDYSDSELNRRARYFFDYEDNYTLLEKKIMKKNIAIAILAVLTGTSMATIVYLLYFIETYCVY